MPTRRNINQNPKEKGRNPNSNPFEALSDEEEHFGMYETTPTIGQIFPNTSRRILTSPVAHSGNASFLSLEKTSGSCSSSKKKSLKKSKKKKGSKYKFGYNYQCGIFSKKLIETYVWS